MILGNVNDISSMIELNPKFVTAVESALKLSPLSLKEGSYPIDGDNIFMNVMSLTTQPAENKKFELHQSYIDIQIILQGEERMDFATLHQAITPDEYNEKDDYQLCEQVTLEQSVVVKEGMFAIFMPNEPHKPGVSVNATISSVKKVVIKLKLSQLY